MNETEGYPKPCPECGGSGHALLPFLVILRGSFWHFKNLDGFDCEMDYFVGESLREGDIMVLVQAVDPSAAIGKARKELETLCRRTRFWASANTESEGGK